MQLDTIKQKIHTIRGMQVMLDRDLAELYEVETRALNQSVKRNIERFPEEFMFRLTRIEFEHLRISFNQDWVSQNVIPNSTKMSLRIRPYVFTEYGVAALSGILKSKKAIEVNISIIKAFVVMRHFLSKNSRIFTKFQQIDQKLLEHDSQFEKVFSALHTQKPKQGIFFDGQIFDAYSKKVGVPVLFPQHSLSYGLESMIIKKSSDICKVSVRMHKAVCDVWYDDNNAGRVEVPQEGYVRDIDAYIINK